MDEWISEVTRPLDKWIKILNKTPGYPLARSGWGTPLPGLDGGGTPGTPPGLDGGGGGGRVPRVTPPTRSGLDRAA